MADCNDPGGNAPEGSVEDLMADLDEVAAAFTAEAEQNWADRGSGDVVGPDVGFDAPRPADPQPPYNPRPMLLVRHYQQDERRPIPRRPAADPPLRSQSVRVRDSNDSEVAAVEPGTDYDVEVDLRNVGGLPERNAYVELYVEHREPTAELDVAPDTGELEMAMNASFTLGGFTTLAPGVDRIAVQFFDQSIDDPVDLDNWFFGRFGVDVSDHRTFSTEFYNSHTNYDLGPEFVCRVYDATDLDESGDRPESYIKPGDAAQYENLAPVLATVPGRWVASPGNVTKPLNLESSVTADDTERIGRQTTSIPPNGTVTIPFEYTATPPASDTALTVFYARAYSLSSTDMPEDWSALDHTTSRFVGRTEVGWDR